MIPLVRTSPPTTRVLKHRLHIRTALFTTYDARSHYETQVSRLIPIVKKLSEKRIVSFTILYADDYVNKRIICINF